VTWQPVTGGPLHRTTATLTKAFHEEPGRLLSRGRQNMDVFGILPRFLENLLESEMWSVVLLRYENRTGYHPALVELFRCIFLQGTWRITPAFQSFGALPEHQDTWHTRVSQRTPWFKALGISGRISSQPAALSVLTIRGASAAVMIFPSPKCTSCVFGCFFCHRSKWQWPKKIKSFRSECLKI